MTAVDTNIFVYASDTNDPVKQAKAQALLGRLVGVASKTVIPWQVAGEYLNWLRKWESAGQISHGDVETRFQAVLALFPLAMPTARLLPVYFQMRARYSLSHWDTMLLAACKEAAASTLYSEDLQAGASYDGVVVNPFI